MGVRGAASEVSKGQILHRLEYGDGELGLLGPFQAPSTAEWRRTWGQGGQ